MGTIQSPFRLGRRSGACGRTPVRPVHRDGGGRRPAGDAQQLLGTLHVTDKKGVPLTDVTARELEAKENGKSRPIQSVELDTRPSAVALVLDNNSELSTSFMQSVVAAAAAVIRASPRGPSISGPPGSTDMSPSR